MLLTRAAACVSKEQGVSLARIHCSSHIISSCVDAESQQEKTVFWFSTLRASFEVSMPALAGECLRRLLVVSQLDLALELGSSATSTKQSSYTA